MILWQTHRPGNSGPCGRVSCRVGRQFSVFSSQFSVISVQCSVIAKSPVGRARLRPSRQQSLGSSAQQELRPSEEAGLGHDLLHHLACSESAMMPRQLLRPSLVVPGEILRVFRQDDKTEVSDGTVGVQVCPVVLIRAQLIGVAKQFGEKIAALVDRPGCAVTASPKHNSTHQCSLNSGTVGVLTVGHP